MVTLTKGSAEVMVCMIRLTVWANVRVWISRGHAWNRCIIIEASN